MKNRTPKLLATVALTVATLLPVAGHAAKAPEAVARHITQSILAHSNGQVQVTAVNETPIEGFYEVVTDTDVFYADKSGRYAFLEGRLLDMQTKNDMTSTRLAEVHRIPFESLPLHLAIKEVRGNGSRTFAVFEDSLCPICQVFAKFVDQLDDVTVYRFPFPVISEDSARPARVAWCAADRTATWRATMAGQRPRGDESCNVTGLVDILRIGEKYNITNTPTVVLLDGTRLVGATPPEEFIEAINQSVRR